MRYIGDIHGKIAEYAAIVSGCAASVQVGDFGYGFADIPAFPASHRFIRGNHDNPALCRVSPNFIPDPTFESGVFYLGGARSIDMDSRRIGVDWWDNEELSYPELNICIDAYANARPRLMVTHECPEGVVRTLFGRGLFPSRTGSALQAMLEIHEPEMWIFGHWHTSCRKTVGNTQFICLDELEYLDI